MSRAEKHIVDTYSELLSGLSKADLKEIMAWLSDAIHQKKSSSKDAFYSSFGGWDKNKRDTIPNADQSRFRL